ETFTLNAVVQCDAPCGLIDHLYVRFWNGGIFLGQKGPNLPTRVGVATLSAVVTAPAHTRECDIYFEVFDPVADLKALSVGLFRGDRAALPAATAGRWTP